MAKLILDWFKVVNHNPRMAQDIETTKLAPLFQQHVANQAAIAAQPVGNGAFAELLRIHLRAQGITPRELERQSDITDTTWGGYLRGQLPSRSTIAAIALALSLPVDSLRALIEAQRDARKVGVRIDTLEQAQVWVAEHAHQTTSAGGA